jgi:site-specific recombinase XerD
VRREKNSSRASAIRFTYYVIGSNKRKWISVGVDARIHDLRHTTGSRTLRKTGNLKVVQTLLGHSTIAITAEFYANVTVEDVRAAMEATAAAEPIALPQLALKKDGEN